MITRLYTPNEGDVLLRLGEERAEDARARDRRPGIARTFQNVELFKTMTVLDNVLVGAQARSGDIEAQAHDALDYCRPGSIAGRPVAYPFGTLKRVELLAPRARRGAEASSSTSPPHGPQPRGGLGARRFIQKIRDDRELTVLLVEHHMNLVMGSPTTCT